MSIDRTVKYGQACTLARIDQLRILLVCTANQCRSPMAEGLLRDRLRASGVDAEVRSAGLMAGGAPATGHARQVLAARGIGLDEHVSRTLDADEVAGADLVLGMERRHVQEAVLRVPAAEAWSFTLRDVADRADMAPPRRDGETVREWAARLAATRPRSALMGIGTDGVDDPIGGPRSEYERTAAELDFLLGRVVSRLFDSVGVEP